MKKVLILKKIIIVLGKAFLNFIYFFIKLFPTKNQIVYTSMQSNNISLDFEMLKNEITKQDGSIKQIFLCKKMIFLDFIARPSVAAIGYHAGASNPVRKCLHSIAGSVIMHSYSLPLEGKLCPREKEVTAGTRFG